MSVRSVCEIEWDFLLTSLVSEENCPSLSCSESGESIMLVTLFGTFFYERTKDSAVLVKYFRDIANFIDSLA